MFVNVSYLYALHTSIDPGCPGAWVFRHRNLSIGKALFAWLGPDHGHKLQAFAMHIWIDR